MKQIRQRLNVILVFFLLIGCQEIQLISGGRSNNYSEYKVASPDQTITVMSFNIRMGHGSEDWGLAPRRLNWGQNLPAVISAIRSVDPEIVGLQEVAGPDQAAKLAKALGMNFAYEWHTGISSTGYREYWGLAILSKFPITKSRSYKVSDYRDMILVNLDTGYLPVTVVSFHKNLDQNETQSIDHLLGTFAFTRNPIIITGDFNIDSSIWATFEDGRLKPLEARFSDTFKGVDSENSVRVNDFGTFMGGWGGAKRMRIDYIFVEKRYFRTVDVGLASDKHLNASDHHAYFAKVKFRGGTQ